VFSAVVYVVTGPLCEKPQKEKKIRRKALQALFMWKLFLKKMSYQI
jgi:hypothetical protein